MVLQSYSHDCGVEMIILRKKMDNIIIKLNKICSFAEMNTGGMLQNC